MSYSRWRLPRQVIIQILVKKIIGLFAETKAGEEKIDEKKRNRIYKILSVIAGFIKGDIIIAIDGKAIGDIYDYMYRLGELKSGQTVIVDVNRDDQILKLEVTL